MSDKRSYKKDLEGIKSDFERVTVKVFSELVSDAEDTILTPFQEDMVVKQINSAMLNFEAFLRAIRKYQL